MAKNLLYKRPKIELPKAHLGHFPFLLFCSEALMVMVPESQRGAGVCQNYLDFVQIRQFCGTVERDVPALVLQVVHIDIPLFEAIFGISQIAA